MVRQQPQTRSNNLDSEVLDGLDPSASKSEGVSASFARQLVDSFLDNYFSKPSDAPTDVDYLNREIAQEIIGDPDDYQNNRGANMPQTFAVTKEQRRKTMFYVDKFRVPGRRLDNVLLFRHEDTLHALNDIEVKEFVETHRIMYNIPDSLKEEVFKLRYKVYCEQRGWEPPNSAKKDRDYYDDLDCTHHVSLQNTETEGVVGTSRIIVKTQENPVQLPVEKIFNVDLLEENAGEPVCEISRLCKHPNATSSLILPTLAFISLHKVMCIENIPNAYMIMEPRLAKLLQRGAGINCQKISRTINYKGPRALYRIPAQIAKDAVEKNKRVKHLIFHYGRQIDTVASAVAIERLQMPAIVPDDSKSKMVKYDGNNLIK
ncbi:acyl-homoserine-lactone synthase [Candidatus Absconditicoccus praedator]|uniref:acyl-homoserine-lactone synthase n=1 Tax=Candidatus Absconditicoccus praedator TaxID=2735562 RepID=UPI001E4AB99C|nr:GNAT family N-acyltransferase [Candidatus Absconditicoccus praedator]UFX83138.1 GNAT family N-acetyltransferase [Candidatus Absconditicoccus praedator]